MKTRCSPLIANPESTHGLQCRREHGPASGQPPLPLSHPPPRTASIFVPWDLQTRGPQSEKPPFPPAFLLPSCYSLSFQMLDGPQAKLPSNIRPSPPQIPVSTATVTTVLHQIQDPSDCMMLTIACTRQQKRGYIGKALMVMIQHKKGAPQDRGDQACNSEGSRDSP